MSMTQGRSALVAVGPDRHDDGSALLQVLITAGKTPLPVRHSMGATAGAARRSRAAITIDSAGTRYRTAVEMIASTTSSS